MSDLSGTAMRSTVEPQQDNAGLQRGQKLMAAGGLLGALAASSCCITTENQTCVLWAPCEVKGQPGAKATRRLRELGTQAPY
jgi:hypothetical protein